jgi:hypothetical protein
LHYETVNISKKSRNWYDYEVEDEPPENPAGRDHAPECTGFLSTSLVVEDA